MVGRVQIVKYDWGRNAGPNMPNQMLNHFPTNDLDSLIDWVKVLSSLLLFLLHVGVFLATATVFFVR
jgi:hypothetical protein